MLEYHCWTTTFRTWWVRMSSSDRHNHGLHFVNNQVSSGEHQNREDSLKVCLFIILFAPCLCLPSHLFLSITEVHLSPEVRHRRWAVEDTCALKDKIAAPCFCCRAHAGTTFQSLTNPSPSLFDPHGNSAGRFTVEWELRSGSVQRTVSSF